MVTTLVVVLIDVSPVRCKNLLIQSGLAAVMVVSGDATQVTLLKIVRRVNFFPMQNSAASHANHEISRIGIWNWMQRHVLGFAIPITLALPMVTHVYHLCRRGWR